MALINPEVIGLARVRYTVDKRVGVYADYEFSNGFDAVNVAGASPGARPLSVPAQGFIVMFLSEPVAPGITTTQGGIKAIVNPVAVSTPSAPAPVVPMVNLKWFYGLYNMPSGYEKVDPEKAIVISATDGNPGSPWADSFSFDIVVFRDPMTEFLGKKTAG